MPEAELLRRKYALLQATKKRKAKNKEGQRASHLQEVLFLFVKKKVLYIFQNCHIKIEYLKNVNNVLKTGNYVTVVHQN